MSLFRRTYRIESARHPHWDYAGAGWYFVTINTRQRRHFFGEIAPLINDSGWFNDVAPVPVVETPRRGFSTTGTGAHKTKTGQEITPGAICSPGDPVPRAFRGRKNHIILSGIGRIVAGEWLKTPVIRAYVDMDEWVIMPDHMHAIIVIHDRNDNAPVETPRRGVSTGALSIKNWQPGSLGAIINQFKGQCTKRIRADLEPSFGWQTRFHDRIIRTRKELDRIRRYIKTNPDRWKG